MQPVHMFPSAPMPPLLLEVLMTASISGADRSPFSTTAGSQVTVKIPCEEGKEQVPVGPLLIKVRCKVHGRAREKFGVRCRKQGWGAVPEDAPGCAARLSTAAPDVLLQRQAPRQRSIAARRRYDNQEHAKQCLGGLFDPVELRTDTASALVGVTLFSLTLL